MDKRDSIKKKVKALLDKTTENGASESEALSALQKARDLMMEYFIDEHEINDPFISEKCILAETPLFKTGYDITNIYPALSLLFDTRHFWNAQRVCFFGYEEDVQLCIYFYNFILKSCFVEKDKFVSSEYYQRLKTRYHGRTLVSSFVKGFIASVCQRMEQMYEERKTNVSECVGLAIISKVQKVDKAFYEEGIKTRQKRSGELKAQWHAFNHGVEKGNEVHIQQGIYDSKAERITKGYLLSKNK